MKPSTEKKMKTSPQNQIQLHSRVRPFFKSYPMIGEVIEIGYSSLSGRDVLVFGVKWNNGTRGYYDETEVTLAGCSKPGCGYPDGEPCIGCGLIVEPELSESVKATHEKPRRSSTRSPWRQSRARQSQGAKQRSGAQGG